MITNERMAHFIQFVLERHRVWVNRNAGKPKPWTQDPILQQYRFCNVYRELDYVTLWLKKHWREAYCHDEDFWFSMVIARLINWPNTMEVMGPPLPWDPDMFVKDIEHLQARGPGPVFGPAYIVSTNGRAMPKAQYLAEQVLTPMWERREYLRPTLDDTLRSYHARLSEFQGMGSFMAAQVVADLKNTRACALWHAADWWTWASPGPGSIRGMNRLCGRGGVAGGFRGDEWHRLLAVVQKDLNVQLARKHYASIHAQDVQNCLCEFDKYERVRLGEGTPKQRYPGV